MLRSQVFLSQILTLLLAGWCSAQEVRYYEDNGITYRETRQLAREPVAAAQAKPEPQPTNRPQWVTEQRTCLRTYYVPTTGYRAETYWVGLWNPFEEPYLATRYVPVTVYQPQTQRVTMPVAVCRPTPTTQVAASGPSARSVCQQTVSRVAVHGEPSDSGTPSTQLARRNQSASSEPVARMAAVPARPPVSTARSSVVPPSSIPTPAYVRTAPAAPAYVPAPAASPGASAAYAPPSGMSYGGQAVGGVSRLDKGPAPWGSR